MRLQMVVWCAVFCFSILTSISCSPRIIMLRGGPTPAWVDRLPRRVGELCAIGFSGPTFYQQDCIQNANENARAQLAHSISVTIRSVSIDISDGTRGYFSQDVFVQGSESASQAVLQGSEVQAQWMDVQGSRGLKNSCYTMVCIDPTKPVEKFAEILTEKKVPHKTIEEVRTNAEAAFKELEQAEDSGQGIMIREGPPPLDSPKSLEPKLPPKLSIDPKPGDSTQNTSTDEPGVLDDRPEQDQTDREPQEDEEDDSGSLHAAAKPR